MVAFLREFPLKIHPLSIVTLVVLDLLWTIPELILGAISFGVLSVFMVIAIFIIAVLVISYIQSTQDNDTTTVALIKGILLGAIAAFPLCFTTWLLAGIYKIIQLITFADKTWLVGYFVKMMANFEELARNKAESLGYDGVIGRYGESMPAIIDFLRRKKVISAKDVENITFARDAARQPGVHHDKWNNLVEAVKKFGPTYRKIKKQLAV